MKNIQITTVGNEQFSINLDHQIYTKVSADGTEVCFFSSSYRLVFTTDEKSIRTTIISKDMMNHIVEQLEKSYE